MKTSKPASPPWRASHVVRYWIAATAKPQTIAVLADASGIARDEDGDPVVRLVGDAWHWTGLVGTTRPTRFEIRARAGRRPRAGVAATHQVSVSLPGRPQRSVRMTDAELAAYGKAAKAAGMGIGAWFASLAGPENASAARIRELADKSSGRATGATPRRSRVAAASK